MPRSVAAHMTSASRRKIIFALAATPLAALSAADARAAPSIGYSREAQRVLSQARAAVGGAGWNYLRGWRETGREDGMAYEAWQDPLRYGLRVERREPAGLQVRGFNGFGAWRSYPDRPPTGTGESRAVGQARTEAFLRVHGFFYPGRFDAHGEYRGVRTGPGGGRFDVVSVTPWGGHASELWFDRRTHRLARIVERTGVRPLITSLSDYRRVGPVTIAFRAVIEGGDLAAPQVRQAESVVFTPADRAMFSLPRPAAAGA